MKNNLIQIDSFFSQNTTSFYKTQQKHGRLKKLVHFLGLDKVYDPVSFAVLWEGYYALWCEPLPEFSFHSTGVYWTLPDLPLVTRFSWTEFLFRSIFTVCRWCGPGSISSFLSQKRLHWKRSCCLKCRSSRIVDFHHELGWNLMTGRLGQHHVKVKLNDKTSWSTLQPLPIIMNCGQLSKITRLSKQPAEINFLWRVSGLAISCI